MPWFRLVGDILATLVTGFLLLYVFVLAVVHPALEIAGHRPFPAWRFLPRLLLYTALVWAWLFIRGQLA